LTAELKRARREHAGNSVDEIFHEATSSESAGQGNLAMSFGLSDHAPTVIRRSPEGSRTATESLTHQSINKHGQVSTPVGRKFDYVVSIHEVRQGHLGVTEYRNGGLALNEFPGGIATNGLPALTSPSTSSLRGNNHELQSLPTAPVAVNELLLAGKGPVK
jgi:hypothetical protein